MNFKRLAPLLVALVSLFAVAMPTAIAQTCNCTDDKVIAEVQNDNGVEAETTVVTTTVTTETTTTETTAPTPTPTPTPAVDVAKVVQTEPAALCAIATLSDCVDVFLCDDGAVTYANRLGGLEFVPGCDIAIRGAARPDTVPTQTYPPVLPTVTTVPAIPINCTGAICFTG